jgi:hypothetical protein
VRTYQTQAVHDQTLVAYTAACKRAGLRVDHGRKLDAGATMAGITQEVDERVRGEKLFRISEDGGRVLLEVRFNAEPDKHPLFGKVLLDPSKEDRLTFIQNVGGIFIEGPEFTYP